MEGSSPAGEPYELFLQETGRPVFIESDEYGNLFGGNTPRIWYLDGDDGGPYKSVPVCLSLV